MRFIAIESGLLGGLLALAALVWRASASDGVLAESGFLGFLSSLPPEFSSPLEIVLGVLVGLALYWLLQWRHHDGLAYWAAALVALLAHVPAVWAHNKLDVFQYTGLTAGAGAVNGQALDAALFLLAAVGLLALYAVGGMRKLEGRMSLQDTLDSERRTAVTSETLVLLSLIAGGLLVSLVVVGVASLLGGLDALLAWSPWTVLIVGVGAALLLALALLLWLRAPMDDTSVP